MSIKRLAQFGEPGCVHIETKLRIGQVSPPHLVMPSQAQYSSVRFVHTSLFRAMPDPGRKVV